MSTRNAALALQIDFDAPEIVSEVYAPSLPTDGNAEFEDRDVVDMIEEERCPLADPAHSDGMHIYFDRENHCARCAMAAPWVRRDGCRQL